jgi:hypothetical protein
MPKPRENSASATKLPKLRRDRNIAFCEHHGQRYRFGGGTVPMPKKPTHDLKPNGGKIPVVQQSNQDT